MLHFTISKRIPDHFFGLNEFPIFVDVALNRQVSVDVVGGVVVGDNSAGDAESSGNYSVTQYGTA